LLLISQLPN